MAAVTDDILSEGSETMARGMTLDKAMAKFYKEHEFRQSPEDEQQIECRLRGSIGTWEAYAFYIDAPMAKEKLAELQRLSEAK